MSHCRDHHVHYDIAGPDRNSDFPGSHFIDSHRDKQRHQEWIGEHSKQKHANRTPAVYECHKMRQFNPAQKTTNCVGVNFICRVGEIDIRHKMLAGTGREIDQHCSDGSPGGGDHADQERVEPAAQSESQRETRGWDGQRRPGQDCGKK